MTTGLGFPDKQVMAQLTAKMLLEVEAVRFMARIAVETEDSIRNKGFQDPPHQPEPQNAEILADAAHHAARDSRAKAIVVFTSRGSSARLISRYRPPVGVFAITPHDTTARQLSCCGLAGAPAARGAVVGLADAGES